MTSKLVEVALARVCNGGYPLLGQTAAKELPKPATPWFYRAFES